VLDAIARLDDERQPIAETCRRVGDFANRNGLPRPSYVHLSRLVVADRERRRERREAIADAVFETLRYGGTDVHRLAERLRDTKRPKATS
jgi:hypothetical protein